MLSVIIPVYNVEKYLRQCLDSVINQTYKDLEIICIDDCSTDLSYEILKEYQKKDSRVKIYQNPKNLKSGLTRNRGLELSTGDYIHFLDSDDWLEVNAYETLMAQLDENTDILYFLWNNIDIKSKKIIPHPAKKIYSDKIDMIVNSGINVWHGIYKKDFLISNSLTFNDYPCMEDIEFTYKVISLTDKIKLLNNHLLNYRMNNANSLMGKFYKYPECVINSYNTIYNYTKNQKDRGKILSSLLNSVLYRIVGSFAFGYLSYSDMKNFASSVDLKELPEGKYLNLYNEIMNYPPFMIRFNYRLKFYLRRNINALYELLKRVKN